MDHHRTVNPPWEYAKSILLLFGAQATVEAVSALSSLRSFNLPPDARSIGPFSLRTLAKFSDSVISNAWHRLLAARPPHSFSPARSRNLTLCHFYKTATC